MFGLGYQAVELLLRAIEGESVIDELVRIPTRLVVRESCGCLPGVPASMRAEDGKVQKPLRRTRPQVESQLTQVMTVAVHNESFWLSQQEVLIGQRLVEACLISLEQNDPLTFHDDPADLDARLPGRRSVRLASRDYHLARSAPTYGR
jgi:hypothetical protein